MTNKKIQKIQLIVLGTIAAAIARPVWSQTALNFVPVTPCRVVNTLTISPPYISGGTSRSFPISGSCGIPSSAYAFSFNVAVVPHAGLGYLTVWPTGQGQPVVATLNSIDGRAKSDAAIIPAGAGGAVSVFASNDTDVFWILTAISSRPALPARWLFSR